MSKNSDATIALLEKHFDIAFGAPDGIKKLRELILSLAMQGKLVPQDPSDQPASELLKEIEAEKERLIKEGKIKQSKPLPKIKPDEVPYDLPKGWEWVRLENIVIFIGGSQPPKNKFIYEEKEGYTRLVQIRDFKSDDFKTYIPNEFANRPFVKSDIMIGRYGPPVFQILRGLRGTYNVALMKADPIHKSLSKDYLFYLLQEPRIQNSVIAESSRTAGQSGVRRELLDSFVVGFPPLAEQRRIVAKIDELMARCDELERLRSDRDRKQITVHTATLDRLLIAKEQSDFNTAWQFITQHFSELYSVKENVTELRKAILQLAVMGKLVPQDPNDQPASELLKEIEKEKERLIKEGKIKKSKPLSEIEPDEFPYIVPKGWEFIRLGQLANEITTGPFGLMIHKSDYIENGVPLINPIHMIDGEIIHDPTVTVTNEKAKQLDSHRLFEGDIIMARRGELGRCALVTKQSDQWLCGTGSFVLRLPLKISRSYILTLFKSQVVRDYLGGNSVGTTMTNLNHGILNKMPVMLPPLEEQHRIVAKIDQLMALCDNLEKQIDAANSKQTNLLNAVMKKI